MSPAHAARLHWESAREEVPAHLELQSKGDFFEREAGAWSLADLGGHLVRRRLDR